MSSTVGRGIKLGMPNPYGKARKVSEVIRKDSIPYAKAKSQANSIKEALLPKLGVGVTDLGIGL